MALASIPNISRFCTFGPAMAVVLTGVVTAGCGSAVFYDEVPDEEEAEAAWLDAPALAPGPAWSEGLSCEDSVGIARVRVVGGIETAKALGKREQQACLAAKAQVLSTLAGMIARGEMRSAACSEARTVFAEAKRCGG